MKTKSKKEFKPTPQMISSAMTVFQAMAYVQTIRPIVEGYQKKVLDLYKFKVAPENVEKGRTCEVITDPKYAWLMSEKDFREYHAECNEERKAANLHVENENHCPLLVAEDLLRLAEMALCMVMEPITGISHDMATRNLDIYGEYIDITLKLLAPYVKG